MGTLKKLRKQAAKLAWRVQIAEDTQRLGELQQKTAQAMGFSKRKEV